MSYLLCGLKRCWLVLLCCCFCFGWASGFAAAASGNYYPSILINGRLERFNDTTRIVYYRLDTLDNSKNWDYTKWNFIKDQVVKEAFADWERALNGRISFRETNDPRMTDIAVHWRNGFDDSNLLGLEKPSIVYGNTFLDSDIQITLTSNGHLLNEQKIKAIALHEIGHALGMNGHSPYPGDIMYPIIQNGVYRLSSRDIATMQMIYEQRPQITNPPSVHLVQYRQSVEVFQNGLRAYQAGQYAKAYPYFVQAVKLYPSNPTYIAMTADSAYRKKDFLNAVAYYKLIEPLKTQDQTIIQYSLADALIQQSQFDLKNGNHSRAQQYLQQSKMYYDNLLKNPSASQAMKKEALSRRKLIDEQLKLIAAQ